MAMDILPVQATSVPYECVFSSAKDTDTAKWNWISPLLMEALQLLKFFLKKERLNFTAGWSTPETAISGIPEQVSKQVSKQVPKQAPKQVSKQVSKQASRSRCDLLRAFFMDNPNAVMDKVLHNFSTYDRDSWIFSFFYFQITRTLHLLVLVLF